MKKIFTSIFVLAAMTANAQFTANNLAVSKITNGGSAITATGVARSVSIVEFSTAGVATATNIVLPSTGVNPKFVVEDRPAAYEGALKLSSDKAYLVGAGFNAAAGTIVGGTPNLRVQERRVLRIASDGTVNLTTVIPNTPDMNGAGTRGSVSPDGLTFYSNSSGANAISIRKSAFASSSSTAFTPASAVPAYRTLNLYGNFIFGTQGSTKVVEYYNTSSADGTAPSVLPIGTQLTNQAAQSFVDIVFFDMDPVMNWNSTGYDLMYISDTNNGVGIRKYNFDGTNWVTTGAATDEFNFNPTTAGANTGIYSMIGRLENGKPTIYGIKYNTTSTYSASYLFKVVDNAAYNLNWSATSTLLASTDNTEQFRGVAFTPNSVITTLPITLTTFSGSLINNAAALRWTTASESNSKEFVIERSNNGVDFVTVGTVKSTNTNNTANYSFQDASLLSGDNYYRLKMVDNDGTFEYSKNIVAVKLSLSDDLKLSVYPNPVSNNLNINHQVAEEGASINVLSIDGRILRKVNVQKLTAQTVIDVTELTSGQYFIQYLNKGKVSSISFIK